jgi:alkylation response protein AidB-like acyl-CoA dehydrogenase
VSTEEELAELRSAIRDFLVARSPESAVRKWMGDPTNYDREVWAQLAGQLRLTALAIPEQYGGDGFGLVELGVAMEEMGRVLLCAPYFSTVALAAPALLASGDHAACTAYLPGIAGGRTIATLAVAEADGSWDAGRVGTLAEPDGDAWLLTGGKQFVVDGATADLLLVVARTVTGPSLFAVDGRAHGFSAEPMATLDRTRPLARVEFSSTPARMVGAGGDAGSVVARALDVAMVALAAEQAGGARRCLEASAGYARERYQFGRAIGSFQAVKHKCADMLVAVELAEAAAREAARLADESAAGSGVAAITAHACCSRAYMFAAMENIQVHGGIGFTWEHPAHLYFRRAKSSQLLFGGPAAYLEQVLERLGI